MPTKAPTACSIPGCPERAALRGRCIKHATHTQRQYEQARGTSTERGYGKDWKAIRDHVLLENPFCHRCWAEGREAYAEHLHHEPNYPTLGTDHYLYQLIPLCQRHHNQLTASRQNQTQRPGI